MANPGHPYLYYRDYSLYDYTLGIMVMQLGPKWVAIIDRVAAHQGWPGLKEELHCIVHGTYVFKELESPTHTCYEY